ncbi:hypothetical protein SAMN05892883_1785 [Jatrophihabitans sp. GAS493]|uniref:hypothetical protein n=1 Tax=Jatrophihabitans sp. GAS493 TaxID=1907575 RepID=UPI000BB7C806|nr:hypothetical protein [Jatrophihabitans sp. GAS493]SOD72386.1 hypothetical protein SAMN05892883_1785 [Jatrophihabitans sp. GAS493]
MAGDRHHPEDRPESETSSPDPAGRALAVREKWRAEVAAFLQPGEELQSVILASSRPGTALRVVATELWPFFADKNKFLLIATDRAWLVLESRSERWRGALTLRYRGPREVRIDSSWFGRFDAFDQPYAIDPAYGPSVNAANDALAALLGGRRWDLAEAADRLAAQPVDPAMTLFERGVMPALRLIPARPKWVRRLREGDDRPPPG